MNRVDIYINNETTSPRQFFVGTKVDEAISYLRGRYQLPLGNIITIADANTLDGVFVPGDFKLKKGITYRYEYGILINLFISILHLYFC